MELATALIWALRIVLPIILFIIYFKLQDSGEPDDKASAGPTGQTYSRARLLGRRKAVIGAPAPEAIDNMRLADATEAPGLFEKANKRGARGGPRRETDEDRAERRERKEREPRGDGDGEERKERKERKERGGKERREPAPAAAPRSPAVAPAAAPVAREMSPPKAAAQDRGVSMPAPAAAPAPPVVPELSEAEEKMHLESLLNYVAFNRKDPQRTFLPDEAPPPPPPPKAPPKTEDPVSAPAPVAAAPGPDTITGDEAAKANAEAQMVLGGAIKFRRVDVAKNLYEKLTEQQVEISDKTYALMIESCVLAVDLKSASDFLLKMEASGHSPDTELLDKVMDLYSQVKNEKKDSKAHVYDESRYAPFAETPDRIVNGDPTLLSQRTPLRTKLSSAAHTFIPGVQPFSGFGASDFSPGPIDFQPMGPPVAPPGDPGDPMAPPPGGEEADIVHAEAHAEAPTLDLAEAVNTRTSLRTALKATSSPFQPQGMVTFNPYDHTWTTNMVPDGIENVSHDQAKGKGKNGRQRKEKADKPQKADKKEKASKEKKAKDEDGDSKKKQ